MKSLNRLGLLVAAVSTLAVLLVFGVILGIRALFTQPPEPTPTTAAPTATPPAQVLNQTDSDNDGLADEIEPIYGTDINNPDTDGDGTNDSDEITLLRDPVTPGPDDTIEQLTETGEIDTSTYTGRYVATLPADANTSDVLSRERLEAFIEEVRLPLVPEVPASSIVTTPEEGKEAVERYLDSVSASHNAELFAVTSEDIANAFQATYSQEDSGALDTIVQKLESNLAALKKIATPAETQELHRTFIAASESLVTNAKLLQNMKSDFVGGLVGAKNIEELGVVFNDIAKQIADLEAKYGLE